IRPNIYIVAELFTGRSERDILFVGELGLDSLIREAMQCSSPTDLVDCVNRFSTQRVSIQPHALLMDCTHDNPTPGQKRTPEDAFPTAAVVAMGACAIGSVRGFDQLCPEHLNVVSDQRQYEYYNELLPVEQLKKLIFKFRDSNWDIQ